MPTNVRHQAVVWRCQNCVNAEGDTGCRVAKWVVGHRQTYNEDLKDKWNKQHSWVGKRVAKMFDSAIYTGTITHWLPDSKTEWELWRIQYEDGDMEELDILELLPILKDHINGNRNKSQATAPPAKTKHELTRKDKRREKKRRRQCTHTISDHDTLHNGQIAGRIHASNTILTTFMATINGSTAGVRGDGHCLRRSLGKLWDMHPGEVIGKMREGARYIQQNAGKLKIESNEEWYECVINRPSQWDSIQTNTSHACSREDWGGDNELCLWAYITQTTIILTNKNRNTYTMYQPDRNSLPTIHDARQLQRLHDSFILRGTEHAYLIYDGYHYNPIRYTNETPRDKNITMPIWVADPPTQKGKRRHIIISIDDSDNDSDSNNEDRNYDEGKHITRHRQKKIKLEQKTERLQCKKRKKTTAEEITPEHRYKAHKTRPGNSGPTSD